MNELDYPFPIPLPGVTGRHRWRLILSTECVLKVGRPTARPSQRSVMGLQVLGAGNCPSRGSIPSGSICSKYFVVLKVETAIAFGKQCLSKTTTGDFTSNSMRLV